jgi:hypothetical protein
MTEDKALVPAREWEEVSPAEIIESVVIGGDLSKLTPPQRVAYYARVCSELGLNPYTQPFAYLWLGRGDDRKLVLYAKRDATDQIRRNLGVNITALDYPSMPEGLFGVTAHAQYGSRTDTATGIVSVMTYDGRNRLTGELLANAMMKAETKAKRRVTLSIAGLGLLDETEIASIPDGEPAGVDDSGNIETPPATVSDVIAARVAAIQSPVVEPVEAVASTVDGSGPLFTVGGVPLPREAEPEGLTKATDNPDDGSQDVEPEPEPDEPEPTMTLEAFVAFVARGYDRDAVRSTARELYPEASGFRQLSEAQLAVLAEAVAIKYPLPAPATAEPPEESEEELLATVMSAEASEALPATCNSRSPFSDATCVKPIEHAGVHTASLANATETW